MKTIDDFVNNLVEEANSELNITKIDIVESYAHSRIKKGDVTGYTLLEYVNGWHSKMRGLNYGAGITPTYTIKKRR